ncbi:MAG: M48 family metallopeptidase [Rhodospirillaceae bacterium]|nr:M48 family metallopeptidase [Rhodospirillaceae bacterium]
MKALLRVKGAEEPEILRVPLSNGIEAELHVRRSTRARRVILRLSPRSNILELVLPMRASLKSGLAFVHQREQWIIDCLADQPAHRPLQDGAMIPFLGENLVLRHIERSRGIPYREGDALVVPGLHAHLPRRTLDWLRRQARDIITPKAREKAARISKPVGRITLRDPATRWGSCSPSGDLSFSWRLVMAPERVLDYVVVHEIAHLRELNHGAAFWALVEELFGDPTAEKQWLRTHGPALHSYR